MAEIEDKLKEGLEMSKLIAIMTTILESFYGGLDQFVEDKAVDGL